MKRCKSCRLVVPIVLNCPLVPDMFVYIPLCMMTDVRLCVKRMHEFNLYSRPPLGEQARAVVSKFSTVRMLPGSQEASTEMFA